MTTENLLRAVLAALLLAPLAAVQAATAVLDRMVGQPTIFEVGPAGARQVSLPRRGAEYRLPIEIETGADDAVTFHLPDSEVAVAPNSMMRIAAPEASERGLLQRILQQAGAALFSVDRREVEHFQVETPYLVSVVKGTTFNVVVHDAGATVALHEGRLLVASADGSRQVDLLPGDVAFSAGAGELEKIPGSVPRRAAADAAAGATAQRSGATADPLDSASASPVRTADTRSVVDADLDLARVALLDAVPTDDVSGDLVAAIGPAGDDLALEPGGDVALEIGDVARPGDDLAAVLDDTGGALVEDLGGAVGDTVAGLGDDLGELANGITGTVTDLTGEVAGTVGDLTGDVGAVAGDLGADLVDAGAGITDTVGGAVGGLVGDLADGDLDLTGTTGELVGGLTGESTDLVSDVVDSGANLVDVTDDLAGDLLDDDLGESLGGVVDDDPIDGTVAGLRGSLRGLLGGHGR